MKDMDQYKTYEYSTGDPETGSWCTVYELDKALQAIKVRNMDNMDRIRRLEKENNDLKNHSYKDKELAAMRNELNKMKSEYYRGFPISEDKENKINEWIEKHEREVHGIKTYADKLSRHGCCGGSYTYEFIPTSIGTLGTVRCSCGAKFTFQDMV